MTDIKLKSGRTLFANQNILGIGEDGDLYGGYDQELFPEGEEDFCEFTPHEIVEISQIAIERWMTLRAMALVAISKATGD